MLILPVSLLVCALLLEVYLDLTGD